MKSIKVCEYSRSRSFHDDLILQDQASGERSQDQWSSGSIFAAEKYLCYILHGHVFVLGLWNSSNAIKTKQILLLLI